MTDTQGKKLPDEAEFENREWIESLESVYEREGPGRVGDLLARLRIQAQKHGVPTPCPGTTPYINTIPREQEPPFPGNWEIERRIKSIIRWNAMAMVVRANRAETGIGGHISTYASAATLFEVAFNHFLHAKTGERDSDMVYFQGHASPGIYARAYVEGRLTEKDLENFRRELKPGGGLSSYPHPWLMPDFWEFPTVSMGLAPIMAIYQARFNQYLKNRGLKPHAVEKVWAFLGDGEMDEPEALGAITLASREQLDNLIFVVNCNLQRLDGPVRGNGKVIQELEAAFRGAGWNVIKVIWGDDWDPLIEKDTTGLLVKRMDEVVDGQYQKYTVSGGDYIRKDFFGKYPELLDLVKGYSDEQLRKLKRGGHDTRKVYAAYKAAVEHTGSPTVILAQTIKGYGLGESGEGKNITHQQKKLNEQELREFRSRFSIPISDDHVAEAPFYRPPEDSEEIRYLHARRRELGGYLPSRTVNALSVRTPPETLFAEFYEGTGEREVATTMVFVHLLSKLLRDPEIGRYVVPIVPDEARTFGMESLFRQVGIYSRLGQLYEPVDRENLLYYREARDGAVLEEGISEAGAMCSFLAAGTSYATHGINTIPFFIFYSMFGFQRIGDLIWAAADMRTRGFLVGGTAGRTTLAGEGLQHQDGHSHVLAHPVPNLLAYDPAFAYELAVIVRDGIYRMFEKQEDIFYYLTVTNEPYRMPAMPNGSREGILKGIHKLEECTEAPPGSIGPAPNGPSTREDKRCKAHLLASGAIVNEAVEARRILMGTYGIPADVWSVTSYKELYRDAVETERYNLLHPEQDPRVPYIGRVLSDEGGVFVAVSDYLKVLPNSLAKWVPGRLVALGTDGFGRSDSRASLRRFFEVDAHHIAFAALSALSRDDLIERSIVTRAIAELGIDPERPSPWFS
jgi:pyruvate dehydrogenase E1 component